MYSVLENNTIDAKISCCTMFLLNRFYLFFFLIKVSVANVDNKDTQSNDILRFEQLRRELIELEKRVQKSADNAQKEVCFLIYAF